MVGIKSNLEKMEVEWHGGSVVSAVASQQKDPEFK